ETSRRLFIAGQQRVDIVRSTFLMWAAEPHLEERKRTGFMVMIFMAIFTVLIYLTKRSIYANKEH
ncbi:cytochrome c1, partial [Rhizobium johnstonii]